MPLTACLRHSLHGHSLLQVVAQLCRPPLCSDTAKMRLCHCDYGHALDRRCLLNDHLKLLYCLTALNTNTDVAWLPGRNLDTTSRNISQIGCCRKVMFLECVLRSLHWPWGSTDALCLKILPSSHHAALEDQSVHHWIDVSPCA